MELGAWDLELSSRRAEFSVRVRSRVFGYFVI